MSEKIKNLVVDTTAFLKNTQLQVNSIGFLFDHFIYIFIFRILLKMFILAKKFLKK